MPEKDKAVTAVTAVTELFDWIVTKKHLRGSRKNDLGLWIHNSAKPKSFDPLTRIAELEDGTRFYLQKKTACKALGLDKASEAFLDKIYL